MAARLGQAPAGVSFKAINPAVCPILRGHEKLQLIKRLPAPFIRHLLASHRAGQLCAKAAAAELGLAHTRFYKLYSQYLQACAAGQAQTWAPRVSGGDHRPRWSVEVTALLTKLLSSEPPSSYSACASELLRRLHFKTNRASVRRWAIQNHLAPDTRYKPTHDYWQKRLPPLLAADRILELQGANRLLDQLLPHVNQHEIHRELGTTPGTARQQARNENRSVLRPVPTCPWWPLVWSQRTHVRVGDDGKVPVGSQRLSIAAPPRSTVVRCLRPDGDIYYLRHSPDPKTKPLVLLHCPIF